jgi:hypothetical protein
MKFQNMPGLRIPEAKKTPSKKIHGFFLFFFSGTTGPVKTNPHDAKSRPSIVRAIPPGESAGIMNRKNSPVNCLLVNPSAPITSFHLFSMERMPMKAIIRYIEVRKGSRSARIVPSSMPYRIASRRIRRQVPYPLPISAVHGFSLEKRSDP